MQAGRGSGKGLQTETLIPTPDGWAVLGDLKIGDEIFDEAGNPCSIEAVYDYIPERLYRVVFSDGMSLDADGDHRWTTWEHKDRKAWGRSSRNDGPLPEDWPSWVSVDGFGRQTGIGPKTRDTTEIIRTLRYGKRGDRNHSIPTTAPLHLSPRPLPVDPWVLGYWLGNGSTGGSAVTAHPDDEGFVRERSIAGGYDCGAPVSTGARAPTFSLYGLIGDLRVAGVETEKHIPPVYLRASAEQRLALLRGLMDSDGYAGGSHPPVEFCSISERLASDVTELARTLGEKPVLAKGRAMLDGVDMGPKYRVTWRPSRHNPFSSPRKSADVSMPTAQGSRSFHRMIKAVEPIPIRPVRCLTVDSPHGLFLAGEGMIPTHNSRAGAEDTIAYAEDNPKSDIALVGHRRIDVKQTMFEQGIIPLLHPSQLKGGSLSKAWNRSELTLELWNGSRLFGFYSEAPDGLRGPNLHRAWVDEPGKFADATHSIKTIDTTWSNLVLALRLGPHPQIVITGTPKPVQLVQEIIAYDRCVVSHDTTYANLPNLAPSVREEILEMYEGTRLARQELQAELLDDVEGALWSQSWIDGDRVYEEPDTSFFRELVVAVDPAVTSGPDADETGVIVAGIDEDGVVYILEDRTTHGLSPLEWATDVVDAYHEWDADKVIVEANHGHDLLTTVLGQVDPGVPVAKVHASRGKATRAQPVSALYEKRRRVRHVGALAKLEHQLTTWSPDAARSPDRLDALVWAVSYLCRFDTGRRRTVRVAGSRAA